MESNKKKGLDGTILFIHVQTYREKLKMIAKWSICVEKSREKIIQQDPSHGLFN
jgi:hypothetical protein